MNMYNRTRASAGIATNFLSLLAFLAWQHAALAQSADGNLVVNGGFETVDKEPTTFDQLTRAQGWGDVTIGLAELFSKEAKEKTVGIPANFYGNMEPAEGAHYAGFFAWKDDQRRNYEGDPQDPFMPGWNAYSEYPWTKLSQPLKEGHVYEISFRVALAQNSDRAIAGIGAYVSPVELNYPNRSFLKERPQVVEEKMLDQRGVWTEVKGTFTADGGEQYLVLGTFPTAIFETKRIIEGLDNQFAYFYLDQVVLKEVPSPAKH
jgi:hypothetical protein